MIKIEKACPNCGSHNIAFVNYLSRDRWSDRHAVVCKSCGQSTPKLFSQTATLECWKNNCIYVAPVRDDEE